MLDINKFVNQQISFLLAYIILIAHQDVVLKIIVECIYKKCDQVLILAEIIMDE